jgi:hypothetical protein
LVEIRCGESDREIAAGAVRGDLSSVLSLVSGIAELGPAINAS